MKRISAVLAFAVAIVAAVYNCRVEQPFSTVFERKFAFRTALLTTERVTETRVDVWFAGLMCHVFDKTTQKGLRVVILEDKAHPVNLSVPATIDTKPLDDAKIPYDKPAGGYRNIGPLDGAIIRVVGYDKVNKKVVGGMEPAGVMQPGSGSTFDKRVPHLFRVTNKMLDVQKAALASPLLAADKQYAAAFLLEGGELDAPSKYCEPAVFRKDHEFKAKKPREFADDVVLTGTVPQEVALELTIDGKTVVVPFTVRMSAVTLYVSAESDSGHSHFTLFQRLSVPLSADWDEVDSEDENANCPDSGAIPGCSNNQWP